MNCYYVLLLLLYAIILYYYYVQVQVLLLYCYCTLITVSLSDLLSFSKPYWQFISCMRQLDGLVKSIQLVIERDTAMSNDIFDMEAFSLEHSHAELEQTETA